MMAASYAVVKAAVIDVVDDFTEKDVAANYAPKGVKQYSAKTKLASLGINGPMLAAMPVRFNKALSKVVGSGWTPVGTLDLVGQTTIGHLILLACAAGEIKVPYGEPT
jgi:hypothetical protein